MSKLTITPTGVKAILIIASLIPLYVFVFIALSSSVLTGLLFLILIFVCLSHMYYGYKWAKFSVAFLSLVFAASQFFIMKFALTDLRSMVFFAAFFLLIVNTVLLLRSTSVKEFLSLQATHRSNPVLLTLKISRWTLAVVVAIALAQDLIRILR